MAEETNVGAAAQPFPPVPDTADATPPTVPTQPLTPASSLTGVQSAPPPPAAGTPSVWKDIAMGAIWGLSGSAGQKHFGGGLGAGAAGAFAGKQQQVENAQRQQQIQFESVKAADEHIRALDEHKTADQLSDTRKLEYKKANAEYQAFMQNEFGIEPDLSFNDNTADAMGAMSTLAQRNGGQVPSIATVHQPEPDGTEGKVAVYSPSQAQFQQNSAKFRSFVDTQRAAQGLPAIDDATWKSMGFKGQRDAFNSAVEFFKPTPKFTLNKGSQDYLPNVLSEKKLQLEQYQKHTDVNGKADADPAVVKQMQSGINYLQSAWDQNTSMEADQAKKTTQAKIDTETSPENIAAQSKLAAAKSGAEAEAKGSVEDRRAAAQDWRPKITADEKKKAGLSENIAFNANSVNALLARRPDLVGSIRGRFTNAEQMAGNNDPDISALGIAVHNIAMANNGVHGLRSAEEVQRTEQKILNGFKNGPKGVAGALGEITGSVQTFIDEARPESYGTHSKNGGATAFYQNQKAPAGGTPIYASAPGKPRLMSTDGGKTWQPAPTNP